MKNIILALLSAVLFLASCSNDSPLVKEIKSLESAVDTAPTSDNILQLVSKYQEYIKDNPEDAEWNGRYSYRAASRQLQSGNISNAVKYLDDAVKLYGSSSAAPNAIFLLAETYKTKLKQMGLADTYYQALIEGYPNHEYAAKAKENIKNSIPLETQINATKDNIFTDSTKTKVDPRKARQLTELYKLYASVLPNSPKTPEFLYNTYNVANSARMYRDAANAAEKLYKSYPEYEKAPTAMFLTAFVYENNLKNIDKAETIYTEFLSKHPNNEFAASAKVALENLGKPADEMLQNIRDKNKSGE